MAKYQYRLSGAFAWTSSPGNAVIALANKSGSGKRITLREFEAVVNVGTQFNNGAAGFAGNWHITCVLARGTLADGAPLVATPMDSDASWPSGLAVTRGGTLGSPVTARRFFSDGNVSTSTLQTTGFSAKVGGPTPGSHEYRAARPRLGPTGVIEPITVRPGEQVAVQVEQALRPYGARTFVTLSVRGSPSRTWTVVADDTVRADGQVLVGIDNGSASVVDVVDVGISGYGVYDTTPYLMLVPFTSVDPAALASNQETGFVRMDSAYPDPTTWVTAVRDAPLTPAGAPIVYANDIGAGAPKGFNYLATKDLLGPTLRAFFPEVRSFVANNSASLLPDTLMGCVQHRMFDMLVRKSGMVLRPGEGIAIVAAAETVGSATAAVGGKAPIDFGIQFDVENLVQPYLTLNGLQSGSDIVVLEAGTGNYLQQLDAYSGTSWTWPYDSDIVTSVDVCIYKPGFIPLALRNVTTPAEGLSIPIVQTTDRNYV